ncbi:HAMP domain-containing sensor histidine kinase [Paenibacillus sp. JX-17]|uniref:histidine kinase n=1 Tax=Paenibacillus lacisoli TaxID=3064525 RepID=A0ABT9CE86_9BACL|nr:HAMP domain-containing sensor histidine kinase [Paenibacillus sp. JX-17]MDO7906282.1 HAMP domain-containing sensor histidine kinase [Paenibacillus sp. JX-17]
MFTKLRNRFLIVNLTIITLVMLVAFGAIYIITFQQVQRDIDMELGKVSDSYSRPQEDRGPRSEPSTGSNARRDQGGIFPDNGGPPPERAVSFMLQTDMSRKLTGTESRIQNVDADFFAQALKKALSMNRNEGQFELDDSRWAFLLRENNEGYMYVFMDVSERHSILTNLIYTFVIVALAMLLVLYFTSRYFANRSIKPIREAFEKQKQFIADASHELKTPLTIIGTNADVLLANGSEPIDSQSKWLHYIKSETERMTKLTNDLLYLTEMEDSRTGLVYAKFDLSEAVETIILTMEAVIYEKEIALEYDIEPELMVTGNREQMKQVVMILLDNAVKYANPRGTVTLTLKKQHNETVLAVTNTGEGIAPLHLTRIFDRFYRTDTSRARKQGGYGLGLAIAKSIIDQHKGRLYAKSTEGECATFYVHLS